MKVTGSARVVLFDPGWQTKDPESMTTPPKRRKSVGLFGDE